MSILEELKALLSPILPIKTGKFSDDPPDKYIVLTPMSDEFAVFGDNKPLIDVSEVRIGIFVKGNYLETVKQITQILIDADFTISLRRFIEHENDTGYNHYNIDVQKYYL